jgi:hypothetical protein
MADPSGLAPASSVTLSKIFDLGEPVCSSEKEACKFLRLGLGQDGWDMSVQPAMGSREHCGGLSSALPNV